MCTVTYLPLNNRDFVLTSSRDVPFSREKSLAPKTYLEDGIILTYPKDGKAGGTWIGSSNKKRLICLLNGGFKNHEPRDGYIKSRGIIVKDLLKVKNITNACNEIELENVEPFTLVIVEWNKNLLLFEFVWDGKKKHLKNLPQKPQIWSSSTLYTDEMKNKRRNWFNDWLNEFKIHGIKHRVVQNEILNFHHTAGIGKSNIDVLMKRPTVGTVSITQVSNFNKKIKMGYEEIDQ
jgi:hypothetical protein